MQLPQRSTNRVIHNWYVFCYCEAILAKLLGIVFRVLI